MNVTRQAEEDGRRPSRWNSADVPRRVAERAYKRVYKTPGGCWISKYSTASHGYAQIGWSGATEKRRVVLAHRAAWTFVNGQVPVGMTLDHTCRNRRCVNPAHLRLMDNFENARRTFGKDWQSGTCVNGHPNSMLEDNPHRRTKSGQPRVGKRCSECVKIYSARGTWRASKPGQPYPAHLLLASEREVEQ